MCDSRSTTVDEPVASVIDPEAVWNSWPDRRITVLHGDALSVMTAIASQTIDAVVTDPPYAIKLSRRNALRLGSDQDGAAELVSHEGRVSSDAMPSCASWERDRELEMFTDTSMLGQQSQNWKERATHSRGYADNDPATFQRWCSLWSAECFRVLKPGGHIVAFGGTRTWHRLAVAIEDAGFDVRDSLAWLYATGFPKSVDGSRAVRQAGGTDDEVIRWEGWGTALRPAFEPIVLARKPLTGTVGRNLLDHGTGGLDIDNCSIEARPADGGAYDRRWPSNAFLDAEQARALDTQSVDSRPSRFFWVAKPSQRERIRAGGTTHPTVKPLALMRELVRLVTPPDGVVLDPFAGSGSTVEACLAERRGCVAVERESAYLPLISARVDRRLYGIDVNDPDGSTLRDDADGVAGLFELPTAP